MGRALRRHPNPSRDSARIPLYARIHVTTDDGKPAAPLARCTEIAMGGLRVSAAEGLPPGTPVQLALQLPSGRVFEASGSVVWSRQTLHPSMFGSSADHDDDAVFGIAFNATSPEALLPIAQLFAGLNRERAKARRIRRMRGLPNHA